MGSAGTQIPRIVQLADQLEADIVSRGLKPGDPYLSTVDAAKMLGVSANAANRALQVLAKRNLIDRRQGKGSSITEPPEHGKQASLRRVHLLVHHNYLRTEGLMADGVVVGMQEALPVAQIQFSFLPAQEEGDYVNQLISEALRSSSAEGFVLVRSSLTSQRLLMASGLPMVVHGTLYPSIAGVAWIERDQAQIGRELAEHLLEQGCKRIGVLMRQKLMPGDHVLLDSVADTLAQHGLSADALRVRCTANDEESVGAEVKRLIKADDRPIGFLCRNEPLGHAAKAGVDATDAGCPIVVCDVYKKGAHEVPFAHARSTLRPEEIGAHIGRMLAVQAGGGKPDPDHEIVPVEIIRPA
ncbi:MAG: GntR family transcriptional regulator [Phycisphaera sp.]|nr:GntR family transcriptional regulator [Phycisphaera sp.]